MSRAVYCINETVLSEIDNRLGSVVVSCCCEKLVSGDRDSSETHRGRRTSSVRSRCQARASEDVNMDSLHASPCYNLY
jgi:hypothetical protein